MFEVEIRPPDFNPYTSNYLARVLGFEPRLKVLETSVLPLYYTRKKASPSPSDGGVSEDQKKNFFLITKYPGSSPKYFANLVRLSAKSPCRETRLPAGRFRGFYFKISVTCPAPTVRPPSRIANFKPFSIAIGWISFTVSDVLSPGITISVPGFNSTSPVTSVVRK